MQLFSAQQKKLLFLSSLGGLLEFYDFIIYIYLAPLIEKIFFADNSSYVATLKTLAVFSVGYLVRPLGGLVFSHFGDRYGRKVVFLLTVLFMAVPSFAIGLLPTPAQIGIASPILLLFFRVLQGLAVGGEIPAAITFVTEHAPSQRKGISMAALFFGINTGLLLGSLITTLLTQFYTPEALLSYAWRLPFLLGGFFGIASIFVRKHLEETQAFSALQQKDLVKIPLMTLLKSYRSIVLRCVLLVALGSVGVFFFLYWPSYLVKYFHYDYAQLMPLSTFATLLLNISIILSGYLVDKFSAQWVYFKGALLLFILALPIFLLFATHNLFMVTTSFMVFSIFSSFIPCTYGVMLNEAFPTPIRYSGIALSYNLAFAVFGGLSPILCTFAIEKLDSVFAPAYYIMIIAMLAALACRSLQISSTFFVDKAIVEEKV